MGVRNCSMGAPLLQCSEIPHGVLKASILCVRVCACVRACVLALEGYKISPSEIGTSDKLFVLVYTRRGHS
jgi:hypothetical protein